MTQRKWLTGLILALGGCGVALASGSGPAVRFAAPDWPADASVTGGFGSLIQPGDAGGRYFFAYEGGVTGLSPPTWCDKYVGCGTVDDGGVAWYQWPPTRMIYTPGGFQCGFTIRSLQDAGNELVLKRSVWSTAPTGTTLNLLGDTSSTVIGSTVTGCTDCLVSITGTLPVTPASDTTHTLKVVAQVVDGGPPDGVDTTSFEVDYIASDGGRDTCTTVTLTFDDTFDDEYLQTMFILLDAGIQATFYVNPPRYHQLIRGGNATRFHPGDGYMSKAMVKGLVEQGMDTSEHTLDHHHLDCLPSSGQENQVWNSRTQLILDQIPVHSTAFPFGGDDTSLYETLIQGHQQSGRDIGGLYNGQGACGTTPSCAGCPKGETIPPKSIVKARAWHSLAPTCDETDPETAVQLIEDAGGGWLIVNNHHLCPTVPCGVPGAQTYDAGLVPGAALSFPTGDYLNWISFLKVRASIGTKVRTMREVLGGAIFPPTPYDGGPNYLMNASLEAFSLNGESGHSCSQAPADPDPDCFQQVISGDAMCQLDAGACWVQSTIAHDGLYASRYSVDFQSTGATRIVNKQTHPATDDYYCPPSTITPGKTAFGSLWYKANDVAPMSWYTCNLTSDGGYAGCGWAFLEQTTNFPATGASEDAGWLQAVTILNKDQIPLDAQYYSFGLSLIAVVDGGDHFQIVDQFQFSQPCAKGVDAGNSPTDPGIEDWNATDTTCTAVQQPPECYQQTLSSGAAPITYNDGGAYWTQSTISHSGLYSQRLDFDSLNSGNIKFLTLQSKPPTVLPYCQPTTFDPTQGFTAGFWYQSTSPLPMDVFLWRTTVDAGETFGNGAWVLRKQTSAFAATGSLPFVDDAGVGFVHAVYSEDGGEPADAIAISIGFVSIQDGGSVLIDDLTFTQP